MEPSPDGAPDTPPGMPLSPENEGNFGLQSIIVTRLRRQDVGQRTQSSPHPLMRLWQCRALRMGPFLPRWHASCKSHWLIFLESRKHNIFNATALAPEGTRQLSVEQSLLSSPYSPALAAQRICGQLRAACAVLCQSLGYGRMRLLWEMLRSRQGWCRMQQQ